MSAGPTLPDPAAVERRHAELTEQAAASGYLLTPDAAHAASLIETLERLNVERREEQERIWTEAQSVLHKRGLIGDLVLLVTGQDWHKGVIGIVAGRTNICGMTGWYIGRGISHGGVCQAGMGCRPGIWGDITGIPTGIGIPVICAGADCRTGIIQGK